VEVVELEMVVEMGRGKGVWICVMLGVDVL